MDGEIWRYADLKRVGILSNRTTLARWIKDAGFPKGFRLGANTQAWHSADVMAWVEARAAA